MESSKTQAELKKDKKEMYNRFNYLNTVKRSKGTLTESDHEEIRHLEIRMNLIDNELSSRFGVILKPRKKLFTPDTSVSNSSNNSPQDVNFTEPETQPPVFATVQHIQQQPIQSVQNQVDMQLVNELNSKLSRLEYEASTRNNLVTELTSRIAVLESQNQDLTAKVSRLETQNDRFDNMINQLVESNTQISSRMNQELQIRDDRIKALENKILGLEFAFHNAAPKAAMGYNNFSNFKIPTPHN
jgi:vacuolar-type H+-ATPase subunit I/STV1